MQQIVKYVIPHTEESVISIHKNAKILKLGIQSVETNDMQASMQRGVDLQTVVWALVNGDHKTTFVTVKSLPTGTIKENLDGFVYIGTTQLPARYIGQAVFHVFFEVRSDIDLSLFHVKETETVPHDILLEEIFDEVVEFGEISEKIKKNMFEAFVGNKAAGRRARKQLSELKKKVPDFRQKVLEAYNMRA